MQYYGIFARAYRLEKDLFTNEVSFLLNCSSHSSFFLSEITFSILGDDRHREKCQGTGHGVDPAGYESKHCLFRGGAVNNFKAKTWRTFLRITIDRLADVTKGGY